MKRLLAGLVLFLAACPPKASPPAVEAPVALTVASRADATVYRLSFEKRHQHLVHVQAALPTRGRDTVTIMMATWTPGSYLVREFARHVEGLAAFDGAGKPIAAKKVKKNRWTIAATGTASVAIDYWVYAADLSVRTSFIDDEYAILNGASIFLADTESLDRPHVVELDMPPEWKTVLTSIDAIDGAYVAKDFDALVDGPFMLGNPTVHTREVEGVEHVIASIGGGDDWDAERAAADVERIVRAQVEFWGVVPYRRYIFMNVLSETGGGLEHLGSTIIMGSRFTTQNPTDYRGWLGLVSHEFFHAWNGKRLRPEALGPFDYENEVYTTDLWFVEGFTSYYDDVLVARAGLQDEKQWLGVLAKNIGRVESAPGRHHQSLASASYDAWIKFYRPDANSANSGVSYYGKGAVVAFLLDAFIRERSGGRKSLDDVMLAAYRRFSGAKGYSSEALKALVADVAGPEARAYLERMVETTSPLSYDDAFDWYGLRFVVKKSTKPIPGYLGVVLEANRTVKEVVRTSPAYGAGINVGDELIAIDDDRISDLSKHLAGLPPDTKVSILVARRRHLKRIEVVLGVAPEAKDTIERKAPMAERQKSRLDDVLTPR